MSLTFGAGATDNVNIGSGASIDNLDPVTILAWVYVTTLTQNRTIYCKGPSGSFRTLLRLGDGSGNVQMAVLRTALTNYITNDAPIAADSWRLVAATFDSTAGAGEIANIYVGSLAANAVESAYGTATDGSGTVTDDAANNAFWGNSATVDAPLQGRIAYCAVVDRVMTLAEIQSWQWRPRVVSGCVDFHALGFAGTGTQPDWSGNSNAGTVTGATVSDHVPLPAPFGWMEEWNGAFVAAAAASAPKRLMTLGAG